MQTGRLRPNAPAHAQVKTPKIYFRDSGLLHRLAGVNDAGQLHTWPRLGASWEGFALEETIRRADAAEEESYFWGVHPKRSS